MRRRVHRPRRDRRLLDELLGVLQVIRLGIGAADRRRQGKTREIERDLLSGRVGACEQVVIAEHSVVLVDADMRRPSVAKYLGLVGQVGFSSVLSGSATLDEALQETRFPGLTVLASGAVPPNPSELLGSQTARKLLDDLRSRFDYVVLDSTPLLAVTDAAVLAAGADGVLMVVRFGHTKRDQLTHAVSSLESVGASLLGAVFTMIPTRGAGSYSYNYTYYGSQGGRRTSASQRAQQQQTALKASTGGASSEEPETGAGVAPRLGGRRPREE